MSDADEEIRRMQAARRKLEAGDAGVDPALYGGGKTEYSASIADIGSDDEDIDDKKAPRKLTRNYTAPKEILDDVPMSEDGAHEADPLAARRGPSQKIADRESDYQKKVCF